MAGRYSTTEYAEYAEMGRRGEEQWAAGSGQLAVSGSSDQSSVISDR